MNASTADIALSLEQLLQQQIAHVEKYVEYLAAIKSSISHNDSDGLQQLIQNPPLEANEIEQNQQRQQQLLASAGYSSKESALDDFIGAQKAQTAEQLGALKQALTQNLKQLEQSLFVNTLLLQKSQHRVKQSIRLLAGHAMASAPSSYSRAGEADSGNDGKRIIAQA